MATVRRTCSARTGRGRDRQYSFGKTGLAVETQSQAVHPLQTQLHPDRPVNTMNAKLPLPAGQAQACARRIVSRRQFLRPTSAARASVAWAGPLPAGACISIRWPDSREDCRTMRPGGPPASGFPVQGLDGLAQALDSRLSEESPQPRRLAPRSPVAPAVHGAFVVHPQARSSGAAERKTSRHCSAPGAMGNPLRPTPCPCLPFAPPVCRAGTGRRSLPAAQLRRGR
jgi:hypothetical protein